MSFYDLVKKNFSLSKGSSITWNGIPENGDLAITAQYTVASNSIGLMGTSARTSNRPISDDWII